MDVSILTVTWNSADYIGEQMSSVKSAFQGLKYEHLIADNGSTDGTVTLIRQKFSDINLIANKQNVGFGAANNMLAKRAYGKYFLLLNPDMKVVGDPKDLIAWADDHPEVGVIGSRLIDQKGLANKSTFPRSFPRLSDQLAILLKLPHLIPKLLNRYLLTGFNPEKAQKVDTVQGSCLLVRREIYEKLGHLFDPRYYIWFEDVDLCAEVNRLGFEIWYVPVFICVDYRGQSFEKQPLFWKQKMLTRSMIQYFKKWGPWYGSLILGLFRPAVLLAAWVHDLLFI